MWTTWAPKYLVKDDIGTLEVGKLADFVVLDKDFFTIPVEEIPAIRPQMTVVGGKPRYIGQDFGQQTGTEPIGWQYPAGYRPWAGGSMF
jgi:cytosine/adenosine deaminase-related metal-dependent hydrolase